MKRSADRVKTDDICPETRPSLCSRWLAPAKGLLAVLLIMAPVGMALCDEMYLFDDRGPLLITNTPSPGYNKKVGHSVAGSTLNLDGTVSGRYDRIIEEIAEKHSLSPALVRAVIQVESGFDPLAVSPKGARGLMQLMESTAERFHVRDLFDPHENIMGGVKYLRYLLDFFGDDLSLALAAYNAGEKAVLDHGGLPPFPETVNYVKSVKKLMGFSDVRKKKREGAVEAKPYIAYSRSGDIMITN